VGHAHLPMVGGSDDQGVVEQVKAFERIKNLNEMVV
jgi:hypothetical protein